MVVPPIIGNLLERVSIDTLGPMIETKKKKKVCTNYCRSCNTFV